MLSRTHVRQFLAVVDSGSFTRAASSLNLAQPSLSAGIAELERQLGTRLFVRERRRIGLTSAANTLLPIARTIEREFRRAESQIGDVLVPLRPLRLGILESVASTWLEVALARYRGSEPLELIEGNHRDLQSALAKETIDLALTIVNPADDRFPAKVLFEEDYCLALQAAHPLARKELITAEDVASETMIARRSCEVLLETSRFFTERGVRPRFSMRSPNDDRVMAMVRAGLGVTIAPRSLGQQGIAMVPLKEFDATRVVGLLLGPEWKSQYGPDHPILELFDPGKGGRADNAVSRGFSSGRARDPNAAATASC